MSENLHYDMPREILQEDQNGFRVLYADGTQLFTTDPERVHWLKIESENLVSSWIIWFLQIHFLILFFSMNFHPISFFNFSKNFFANFSKKTIDKNHFL